MKMMRNPIILILIICLFAGSWNTPFCQVKPPTKVTKKINLSKKKNADFKAAGGAEDEMDEKEGENVEAEEDKERKGPANITFNLSGEIESDYDFSGDNILDIFNTVYRDENLASGYFYFLPASYNLSWSENSGKYDFNANYSAAGEGGIGETTVTAILKPGLSRNELKLAKFLLEQNIKGKTEEEYGVTDLIAMPLAQTPEVEFTNLGQFDVSEGDISIRAPSDLAEPIYISFSTSRIDDLMGMFFNNIGLYGDIVIYPDGEGMPNSIRIPFNLKIDDPKTYGRFELEQRNWRKGWQNKTDYPLQLVNFHLMKKESGSTIKVYTWEMGDKEVPENGKVKFEASLVPYWIDTNPNVEKIWMEYSVLPCGSCNSRVKSKIIKGTSGSRVQNIEFTILTPLNFTEADLMKIKIRSYQADPNGLSKRSLPTLTITDDGQTLSGGQLYVADGDDPEFEFLVQIYLEDGTKYEADNWVKSSDLEVVIGKKQIEDMISHFR